MVSGIFIPIFKERRTNNESKSNLQLSRQRLGFEKHVGDEFDVTDERGQVLIAAGVAEEIVEPVEEPEAQESTEEEEKPKRSTKARSKR